jgi:predicted Zn finger-like uncharacterized protein
MPLRVQCPGCAAEYKLVDTLAGKKIRCKKCAAIVPVPRLEEEVVALPAPEKVKAVAPRSRPAPARDDEGEPRPRRRRDEDEDDRPEAKKKLPMAWIIGGSVGGMLLIGGVILAVVLLTRDKSEPAKVTDEGEKGKKADKGGDTGKKDKTEPVEKNDIDSLLADLKKIDPSVDQTRAGNVVKRISANIPADSPRRSEVFKELAQAVERRLGDTAFEADCVRAAVRYADTADAPELVKMLQKYELKGIHAYSDLAADRLAELKNPHCTEEIAQNLTHYDQKKRQRAAKILKGYGESVEKVVQTYARPSGNFTGDEVRRRFEAIELLGDIGSKDSLTFLLALKNEPPLTKEPIDSAVKKIRDRTGEKALP